MSDIWASSGTEVSVVPDIGSCDTIDYYSFLDIDIELTVIF